ncbi:MAG: hypothetical protein VX777_06645 [Chlamydiota bacterium]|nr:hypothetical protein [Chlamydiota bacterium]
MTIVIPPTIQTVNDPFQDIMELIDSKNYSSLIDKLSTDSSESEEFSTLLCKTVPKMQFKKITKDYRLTSLFQKILSQNPRLKQREDFRVCILNKLTKAINAKDQCVQILCLNILGLISNEQVRRTLTKCEDLKIMLMVDAYFELYEENVQFIIGENKLKTIKINTPTTNLLVKVIRFLNNHCFTDIHLDLSTDTQNKLSTHSLIRAINIIEENDHLFKELSFKGQNFNEQIMIKLVNSLKQNIQLKKLSLENCMITPALASKLKSVFNSKCSIHSLNLSNNPLRSKGVSKIFKSIPYGRQIKELDISRTGICTEGVISIGNFLNRTNHYCRITLSREEVSDVNEIYLEVFSTLAQTIQYTSTTPTIPFGPYALSESPVIYDPNRRQYRYASRKDLDIFETALQKNDFKCNSIEYTKNLGLFLELDMLDIPLNQTQFLIDEHLLMIIGYKKNPDQSKADYTYYQKVEYHPDALFRPDTLMYDIDDDYKTLLISIDYS